MKVLIPSTTHIEIQSDDEFVTYDVNSAISVEHLDSDVLIVWQNPQWQLERSARELKNLRLVQTLASGADSVLTAGFESTVPICSGRSLHDGPVAEHALALTLAAIRRLDRLQRSQSAHRWDTEYVRKQSAEETRSQYTLDGARVTIWGFGSIAARLAPMLTALGAKVIGIARSGGQRAGFLVLAESDSYEALADTDVLISLVPSNPATADLFDDAIFSRLPHGAVFINVGRGATVDETALRHALDEGRLRAASIDVTKTEPLSSDSPLWDAPNLIITPHVAGNRPLGAQRLVASNLEALRLGQALINQVNPS